MGCFPSWALSFLIYTGAESSAWRTVRPTQGSAVALCISILFKSSELATSVSESPACLPGSCVTLGTWPQPAEPPSSAVNADRPGASFGAFVKVKGLRGPAGSLHIVGVFSILLLPESPTYHRGALCLILCTVIKPLSPASPTR